MLGLSSVAALEYPFFILLIPITLHIFMPYFDKFIRVYAWNLSILWSPLKIWTPKNCNNLPILGTQFLNLG